MIRVSGGEKDPALLETFPYSADAVGRAVFMQSRILAWGERAVAGVDVAAGEDVGGGEGGGVVDAAEEEDLVLR